MDLKEVFKVLYDDESNETQNVIDAIYDKLRHSNCLYDTASILDFTSKLASCESNMERTILSCEFDDKIGIVEAFVYRSVAEKILNALNEVDSLTYIKAGIYDLLEAMDEVGIVELS